MKKIISILSFLLLLNFSSFSSSNKAEAAIAPTCSSPTGTQVRTGYKLYFVGRMPVCGSGETIRGISAEFDRPNITIAPKDFYVKTMWLSKLVFSDPNWATEFGYVSGYQSGSRADSTKYESTVYYGEGNPVQGKYTEWYLRDVDDRAGVNHRFTISYNSTKAVFELYVDSVLRASQIGTPIAGTADMGLEMLVYEPKAFNLNSSSYASRFKYKKGSTWYDWNTNAKQVIVKSSNVGDLRIDENWNDTNLKTGLKWYKY